MSLSQAGAGSLHFSGRPDRRRSLIAPFGAPHSNFRASSAKLLFNLENPFLKDLARLGKSRYDKKHLEFWRLTDNFR